MPNRCEPAFLDAGGRVTSTQRTFITSRGPRCELRWLQVVTRISKSCTVQCPTRVTEFCDADAKEFCKVWDSQENLFLWHKGFRESAIILRWEVQSAALPLRIQLPLPSARCGQVSLTKDRFGNETCC